MAGRADERFRHLDQFNFLVDFGGGGIGGFQEMSGLDTNPGAEGELRIAFKRGLCRGPELFAWLAMRDERAGAPRRVIVQLRDEARRPVAEWALSGARPAKLEGPALNAKGSDVAVEQLELACECVTVNLHSGPAPN